MILPKRLNQYFTLLSRNIRIQLADRFGMLLTLMLPPIIAILLIVAFWLIGNDTRKNDNQMFVAQAYFDVIEICRKKMPCRENEPCDLFFYKSDNSKQSLEQFKVDLHLHICFGANYAGRDKDVNDIVGTNKAAEEIWSKGDISNVMSYSATNYYDFPFQFSLFLYNLPDTYKKYSTGKVAWPEYVGEETKQKLKARASAIDTLRDGVSGEEATRSNMTVFFILIASAIWMGLLPACKEIVSEWDVFLGESREKVSSMAFLMSKFSVLAVITSLQNIILVFIICRMWQGMTWTHCIALYIVMCLTSICATSIGLMISSITTTLRAGLMIIPMFMVAQLILGGLLRLPAQTQDSGMKSVRTFACKSTIQYWAFEAVSGCVSRLPRMQGQNNPNCIARNREVVTLKKPDNEIKMSKQEINPYLKSEFLRIDNYIFGKIQPSMAMNLLKEIDVPASLCAAEDRENFKYHTGRPVLYIVLMTFVVLFLTWLWLKLRLRVNYNGGLLPFALLQ